MRFYNQIYILERLTFIIRKKIAFEHRINQYIDTNT